MSILWLPLVAIISIPASIGALRVAVHLFHMLSKRFKKETSFVVTLSVMAVLVAAFSAPYWFLGMTGWFILTGVYVFFVAMGGKQTYRIVTFIKRELDDDPTNDVPLDLKGGPATTGKVTSDDDKSGK